MSFQQKLRLTRRLARLAALAAPTLSLLLLDLVAPTMSLASRPETAAHNCGCAPGKACCCLLFKRKGPDTCRRGAPSAACSLGSRPNPTEAPRATTLPTSRQALIPLPASFSPPLETEFRHLETVLSPPGEPIRRPPVPPPKQVPI